MEVTVSLDEKNTTSAYLLGRLFAVIEKAQIDAHHPQKLNSTIKDRYFGSASATPRSVFPMLLRLSQHHIQKAEFGFVSDKRIEEIMCDLKEFPAHLSLEEQGLFAIGYYHQRQALFTKKTEN
jgi:CRISPR-associated protein Csd1